MTVSVCVLILHTLNLSVCLILEDWLKCIGVVSLSSCILGFRPAILSLDTVHNIFLKIECSILSVYWSINVNGNTIYILHGMKWCIRRSFQRIIPLHGMITSYLLTNWLKCVMEFLHNIIWRHFAYRLHGNFSVANHRKQDFVCEYFRYL